jgi:carboxylate-amine ligase
MDVQECPAADLAIVTFVIEILKALVEGSFVDYKEQMSWQAEPLAVLLEKGIDRAEHAVIDDKKYIQAFGLNVNSLKAGELLMHIFEKLVRDGNPLVLQRKTELNTILTKGSLSTRMMRGIGNGYSLGQLLQGYHRLANCLAQNKMFEP